MKRRRTTAEIRESKRKTAEEVEKKHKPLIERDRVLDGYAKQIRAIAKRTVDDLVKIGELLAKAKRRAGHGHYLSWLERELGWSPDWAQNLVELFTFSRTARFRKVRHLPATALYLLAKKSTPETVRVSIAARAEAGEFIKVGDVRREIRRARPVLTLSAPPQSADKLPKITAEDLQAAHRRHLVDLIVDVARQLPSDRSIEEARAVVESVANAEGRRDSFTLAVTALDEFVGELRRALNERLIEVPPAPTLRVIPGKDD
jgi:Protein of unknown function (DUF3102)